MTNSDKYQINFDKLAKKQLEKLKKDKKLLRKALEIFEDISQNPYSPKFKFERLKSNFTGFCSKRLDDKNRIIYIVKDKEVLVLVVSILGHYS